MCTHPETSARPLGVAPRDAVGMPAMKNRELNWYFALTGDTGFVVNAMTHIQDAVVMDRRR